MKPLVVNNLHWLSGTAVVDPYRWLEDPDSEETRAWVDAQVETTKGFLGRCDFRDKIRARIGEVQSLLFLRAWTFSFQALTPWFQVYNYEKFGIPFNHGPWWFFYRNDGLQNQSVRGVFLLFSSPSHTCVLPLLFQVLYKMRSLDDLARAEVLIDLNAEFPEGTTAMSWCVPTAAMRVEQRPFYVLSVVCSTSGSHDGSLYAYGLSVGGSDWVTIRIRDVATGETLPDVVPWVKFSNITWTLDNKGFFYSRYPAVEGVGVGSDASKSAGTEVNKNENHMLYYHVVGTPAEADVCVFEDKSQPLWNVGCELSHNGNILLISVRQ
jgi:prolyl oligopeptidase